VRTSAQIISIRSHIGSDMMKSCIKKCIRKSKQQICLSPSFLRGLFLLCVGCLLAAVLPLEGSAFFVGTAMLMLVYGLLAFRNDRLEYDKSGITMYSILGRPFYISWCDIVGIKIVEEQLVSRQFLSGKVLRIECESKRYKHTKTYRFPYQHYIGIDDFLVFFRTHIANETKKENCGDTEH